MFSTEVVVAIIAAAGVLCATGFSALTANLLAERQAKAHLKTVNDEFLADRDKLLYEQAGKFWNERAQELKDQIRTEKDLRAAETAKLTAEIAQVVLEINEIGFTESRLSAWFRRTRSAKRLFKVLS